MTTSGRLGQCPHCHRWLHVNLSGKLHRHVRMPGRASARCPGSAAPPIGGVERPGPARAGVALQLRAPRIRASGRP